MLIELFGKSLTKNIFIITEFFYPVHRNDSYLITKIAESLSKKHKVNVICDSALLDKEELKTISGEISRLNTSVKKSHSKIYHKLYQLLLSTFRLTVKTLKDVHKGDYVFSVTNPFFFLPILVLIKKIKGFHLTVLVYDIFPDNLIAANKLKKNSLFFKILDNIYKWAYNNIDKLIVIGRDMQDIIENKKDISKNKIHYIPNWCNVSEIVPSNKNDNKIVKKFNLEEKIVFSFVGNFGLLQGIHNILEASLLVKNENFIFLFIGDGILKNDILEFIDKKKSKNILYAGKYPSEEKNTFLNACDISVISLNKNMYGLGVPSKTYYNMAAANPILYIGHEDSEIAKNVHEFDLGWVVESDDPQKLADKFDEICNEKDIFLKKGNRSREICKNEFDEDVILKKYMEVFQ